MTGGEEPVRELQTLTHRDWDAANGGIYFVDAQSAPVLKFFRFDTGRVTAVAPIQRPPFRRGLAASPDGRSFVLVRYPPVRQEIVLSQC